MVVCTDGSGLWFRVCLLRLAESWFRSWVEQLASGLSTAIGVAFASVGAFALGGAFSLGGALGLRGAFPFGGAFSLGGAFSFGGSFSLGVPYPWAAPLLSVVRFAPVSGLLVWAQGSISF